MRWLVLLALLFAGVALAQTPVDLAVDDGGLGDGGAEVPGAPIPEAKKSRFGCSFAR